jgi:hypothetical protein
MKEKEIKNILKKLILESIDTLPENVRNAIKNSDVYNIFIQKSIDDYWGKLFEPIYEHENLTEEKIEKILIEYVDSTKDSGKLDIF